MALGVKNAISEALGVEPVLVNSSKFSAQGRKRLYWTNIPVQALPLFDHPSCLADVLEPVDAVPSDLWLPHDRVVTMLDAEVVKRKIGFVAGGGQGSRIYSVYGKSVTVTAMEGRPDMYAMPCITPERLTKNQHGPRFRPDGGKAFTLTVQDSHGVLVPHGVRCLTPVECERLQTLPDNWTALCDGVPLSPKKRTRLVGNGWTVDVLAHIFKSLIS